MKLVIVGTGYVGLVTGACLADVGHTVTCIDIDARKVERLRQGIVDIYEPGLDAIVKSSVQSQHLSFSTDLRAALPEADAIFLAVGTPPNEDGSTDLSHVLTVARSIGDALEKPLYVVVKSTVPVGTCALVKSTVNQHLKARGKNFQIEVVSNPEFLKKVPLSMISPGLIVLSWDVRAKGRLS